MKGAGALKAHAQRVRQVGAVAGHHRGQHHGVVFERRRGAGRFRIAAGNASNRVGGRVLPAAHAARHKSTGCAAQPLDAIDSDRRRRGDALVQQKIRAAPDAGIVIGLRRQQTHHGAHALAARECLRALSRVAGQRTVSRTPPPTGACASLSSLTTSTLVNAQIHALRMEMRPRARRHSAQIRLWVPCARAPRRPRCLPRCATAHQRARPARVRAPGAAPSPRTTRPAATTTRPAAARPCVARAAPPTPHTRSGERQRDEHETGLQPETACQSNSRRKQPRRMKKRHGRQAGRAAARGGGSDVHGARISEVNLASSVSGTGNPVQ